MQHELNEEGPLGEAFPLVLDQLFHTSRFENRHGSFPILRVNVTHVMLQYATAFDHYAAETIQQITIVYVDVTPTPTPVPQVAVE